MNLVENLSKIVFAQFPPLDSGDIKVEAKIDYRDKLKLKIDYTSDKNVFQYYFPKNKLQKKVTDILLKKSMSISKILNTQGFSVKHLKRSLAVEKN